VRVGTGNSKDFFLEMNTQFIFERSPLDNALVHRRKSWSCYNIFDWRIGHRGFFQQRGIAAVAALQRWGFLGAFEEISFKQIINDCS